MKELKRKQAGEYLSRTRDAVSSSRVKRKDAIKKPSLWSRIKSVFFC
tara:strand:+ start:546 stop:686 length:141 start_codon:yes stop_codon:yes gene_type:complete